MSTPRTLFALTLSFALAAEARFGKRSSDDDATEASSSEKQAEASPVHAATAVSEAPEVHEATPATYVAPASESHEASAVVETDEVETRLGHDRLLLRAFVSADLVLGAGSSSLAKGPRRTGGWCRPSASTSATAAPRPTTARRR